MESVACVGELIVVELTVIPGPKANVVPAWNPMPVSTTVKVCPKLPQFGVAASTRNWAMPGIVPKDVAV